MLVWIAILSALGSTCSKDAAAAATRAGVGDAMDEMVGVGAAIRTAEARSQPPDVSGEWTAVKEWSGENGSTETERFTTAGRRFRVSWKMTELDRGGLLDIFVRDDEGKLVLVVAGLQDHVKRAASGTFVVNSEPGAHYLEIRATGVKWQVAVEQPKG
jgi:hypothetical protein